jgi:hypothetical protein
MPAELSLLERLNKGITSDHAFNASGGIEYDRKYLDFRYKGLLPNGMHIFAEDGLETLPEQELENIYHEFCAAIEDGSKLKLSEFHMFLMLGSAYYTLQTSKQPLNTELNELRKLFQKAAAERLTKNTPMQTELCEQMRLAYLKQAGQLENEESQRFSTKAAHWSDLKDLVTKRFRG